MNAAAIVEMICPGIPVVTGDSDEYDIPGRYITLLHPGGTRLADLMGAAHEAFHALRHHEGHAFYTNWQHMASIRAWNEEATEEARVTAAAEEWLLTHCRHLYTERGIRQAAQSLRCGAIAPDEGYVSLFTTQEDQS